MGSFNKTKIIATIGPASCSKENLRGLIESGMNIARLNFSHGSHDDVLEIINNVRQLNDELGLHVGLLADLQGPKIRLGEVKDGGVPIKSGHQLTITTKKWRVAMPQSSDRCRARIGHVRFYPDRYRIIVKTQQLLSFRRSLFGNTEIVLQLP